MWDVREAALKRYGDHYSSSVRIVDAAHQENDRETEHPAQAMQPNSFEAPGRREAADEDSGIINNNIPGIEVGRNFGDYVANNLIDAGVTLIARLHHGANVEDEGAPGPVTRTGHGKPVKVMCIARCPVGGHFATGSDDGLGRVWADDDDWHLGALDELSEFDPDDDITTHSRNMTLKLRIGASLSCISCFLKRPLSLTSAVVTILFAAPPKGSLLATLRDVHTNAVTDMKYSSAGDRILTASMKDGNVCIWSGFHPPPLPLRFIISSQLCIQLGDASRDGSSTAKVNCDGVAWTCDDMKVITSQSSPAKGSGTEIIPQSHIILVWDSHTGKCLMGITSSHSSLCPSLAPHPYLPSVFASAGADGDVNVWDLDRGDCFYTHSNNLLHGPIEPASDRGKLCGCLEAQFSPDGLYLILTDESGRIIILDTQIPASLRTQSNNVEEKELQEQYFANDYYELAYDANGYCIERGSGRPPHLAPGGVRCTHEGVPYTEVMRATYRDLTGPLPIPPDSAMLYRDVTRCIQNQLERGVISKNSFTKPRRILARNPDFTHSCETAIITKDGNFVQHEGKNISRSTNRLPSATGNRNPNNSTSTDRPLSDRYRWISYNDLPESECEEEDQDDEEFVVNGRRLDESSEDEDERNQFLSQFHRRHESERGRGGSGRNRRRESHAPDDVFREESQPSRASSRQATQRTYNELNSDDEALEELMSTHTKPSGKYVDDWNISGHLFKLPRGGGDLVRRNWLCRTIFHGRKSYCPQVGDSVVYIPKAHNETIRKFWIQDYSPPWRSWPTASSWPVVRCKVIHARYRFPYEMNYKSRSPNEKLQGVAAILTLEISGVPLKSSNRTFPWPAPTFVPPATPRTRANDSIKFEVTLFECDEEDFLIPEYVYSWRVEQLERAISAKGGHVGGLSVTVLCQPDHDSNNEEIEDADHLEFTGRLVHMNETRDDNEFHLFDSGYNALSLKWDVDDDEVPDIQVPYVFSVWSINMANPSCNAPVAPIIGENVRLAIREALHKVMNLDPNANEWFFDHVDTSKYTDYLEMIEVPMYLSLIQKRLRTNYYTNKLSVIADLELMKENCYKYNEDGNNIFELACQMYDKFKSLVDAIEEDHTIGTEEHAIDAENDEQHGFPEASEESSQSQQIEHVDTRATSRGIGQTGGSEESKISSRHCSIDEGQAEGMNDIDNDHQDVSRRQSRRSAVQKSQLAAAGSPCRHSSSRARRKPNYHDEDSADEEHSESSVGDGSDGSDDGVSAVEKEARNKRRLPPRARSKPVYTEKDSEEEERMSDIENVNQELSRRLSRRSSAQKSQLTAAGSPGQRTSLRAKRKPRYEEWLAEGEQSDSSSSSESDGSDDGVTAVDEASLKKRRLPPRARSKPVYTEKNSEAEERIHDIDNEHQVVSRRPTRRSAVQKQSTGAISPCRRSSPRARRKANYEDEDSESSSCSDESDGSDGGVSALDEATLKKRRLPPRARSKPVYTENDSEEEERVSDIENVHQAASSRSTRRPAAQKSHLTASGSPDQRTSLRARRKPSYEKRVVEEERAEGSSSSDDSDESESGVNAVEQASLKKRRLPPRARSKPSYTEKDSEEGDYSESYGEDESEGSHSEVSCEEDSHTKREIVISHKKRKRVSGLAFAPVSKRGRTLQEKKSDYPDLEKWQPISKRLINSMGVAILGKLVSLRLRNIFMMLI